MVEGRSVYPKQEKNKSGEVHTSMEFWSFDTARKLLILRQFDSLGFVSSYVQDKAASRDGHIVVVSETSRRAGSRATHSISSAATSTANTSSSIPMAKAFRPTSSENICEIDKPKDSDGLQGG